MTALAPVEVPSRALVIVAHPDDIDFGVAGTVAHFVAAGAQVTYCLVTSGEAGAPDALRRDEVRALREAEQRAAAHVVGVDDLRFLGYPDGRVEPSLALRRDLSAVIRDVRPDLVLSMSSDRVWDRVYFSHPDHLAVGEAAMCAVYPDARNPWAHMELLEQGFEPHAVPRVCVTGLEPNSYVDITDVIDRKIEALAQHTSQGGHDRGPMLRQWAAENARQAGLPDGRFAELFRQIDTR